MNSTDYVILVVALLVYTAVLVAGVIVARREIQRQTNIYTQVVKNVVEEIKQTVIKEDN
jgi:Na+-transporting NADH:ubiquinone oxidoreductase subunit NqrC